MSIYSRENPVVSDSNALKNLARMREAMKSQGLSMYELSRRAQINASLVCNYVKGEMLPTVSSYNKLAEFFGWEKLYVPEEKFVMAESPQEIVSVRKFTFTAGKSYMIGTKAAGQPESYVFMYERKEGIHHVFIEICGKWRTTYTDAQLIGMRIQEA